ncbi:lipopolysaccharide kinase InaA family protein [Desulfonatronum parangueonense]
MQNTEWIELARTVSLGTYQGMEILRERGGDVRIARVAGPDGDSVVVKLWNRPGPRGALRRWTRTSSARREWRTLCRLHRSGLFVPRPLAYMARLGQGAAHTEGVVSGDLGRCSDAVEHFKELIRSGSGDQEAEFVRQVVRATAVMVRLGLLDTDHRLPNFVVTPNGRPVRLDFELNVRTPWPRWWTKKYGLMLGTLLGSFVFAVQPDRERAVAFAAALRRELNPPLRVLRAAETRMREMLQRQEREIGLRMEVDNPWKL